VLFLQRTITLLYRGPFSAGATTALYNSTCKPRNTAAGASRRQEWTIPQQTFDITSHHHHTFLLRERPRSSSLSYPDETQRPSFAAADHITPLTPIVLGQFSRAKSISSICARTANIFISAFRALPKRYCCLLLNQSNGNDLGQDSQIVRNTIVRQEQRSKYFSRGI
jgi:hypothetical protein